MLAENETGGHVSRLTLVERRQRYDYTCPVETPTKWDAPRCADRSSNAHKSIGLREASVVHGNAAKLYDSGRSPFKARTRGRFGSVPIRLAPNKLSVFVE